MHQVHMAFPEVCRLSLIILKTRLACPRFLPATLLMRVLLPPAHALHMHTTLRVICRPHVSSSRKPADQDASTHLHPNTSNTCGCCHREICLGTSTGEVYEAVLEERERRDRTFRYPLFPSQPALQPLSGPGQTPLICWCSWMQQGHAARHPATWTPCLPALLCQTL